MHHYVTRIIDNPTQPTFWEIHVDETEYHRCIGRLFGGAKLMTAFGFVSEGNGKVLALKKNKVRWEAVPAEVRTELRRKLDELDSHRNSLSEPSISNIAAGASISRWKLSAFYTLCHFIAVSAAVGGLGEDNSVEAQEKWHVAMQTILLILSNVLKFPDDPKYYEISMTNPNFKAK